MQHQLVRVPDHLAEVAGERAELDAAAGRVMHGLVDRAANHRPFSVGRLTFELLQKLHDLAFQLVLVGHFSASC